MAIKFRTLITVLLSFAFLSSCDLKQQTESTDKESSSGFVTNLLSQNDELSEKQQSALDALNTLQTSSVEEDRLYSTFANIQQPFYPADTSLEITQSELLVFMRQFVSKNYQNLETEKRNSLVEKAVLAQEQYLVLHCSSTEVVDYDKGLPMLGTWVLPGILGRRDLILKW